MLSLSTVAPLILWIAALAGCLLVAVRLSLRPLVRLPLLVTNFTRRTGPRATAPWLDPSPLLEPR